MYNNIDSSTSLRSAQDDITLTFNAAMAAAVEPSSTLAVAVSGGADSMALLLLTHEWTSARGGKAVALTVDHGLRKESAHEATQVDAWCESLGIEHHTLKWKHPAAMKKAGIQEMAREARYRLLVNWCKKHGAACLLVGHHRGDQAETLFFRLARGSQLRGLACMPPVSESHGIRLIRPLLGIGKKALMHYLAERGQPWIEDPSNQNPDYTRNLLRARLQALHNADDIERRAAAVAEAFGRIRARLDEKTEAAFRAAVTLRARRATIDATAFAGLAPETALLLTSQLIRRLTGDDHPPRTHKLEHLCRWLAAPNARRATLAHLVFEHRPGEGIFKVFPAA